MTIERIERRSSARRGARGEAIPDDAELTPRVRAMLAALNGEVEILRRDLQAARDRLELAERAADQDHLLPILNRRAFVRALGWHIAGVARYGTAASLLYCDLDGFKRVNDAYGHAAGDAVLAHFAKILCANVRDSDIVGRIGGDEFGIVLAHANVAQATKKAQALTDALTSDVAEWNGARVVVSFSFGAFELSAGDSAETALMRADEAMYAQKRGRPAAD
ncbi:MAG TPA: GGDEF domain-containing protein [Rhizomicrobium sp.]|nr:GGDEF domain-containing protein [Rhizomicrobium sp.]